MALNDRRPLYPELCCLTNHFDIQWLDTMSIFLSSQSRGSAGLFSAGLPHGVSGQVSWWLEGRIEPRSHALLWGAWLVGEPRRGGLVSAPRGLSSPRGLTFLQLEGEATCLEPLLLPHAIGQSLSQAQPDSSGEGQRPQFPRGRDARKRWPPPSPTALLKRRALKTPDASFSALRFPGGAQLPLCPSVPPCPRPQGGLAKGEAQA